MWNAISHCGKQTDQTRTSKQASYLKRTNQHKCMTCLLTFKPQLTNTGIITIQTETMNSMTWTMQ